MNPILVYTYPLSAILILVLAIGVGVFITRKYHLGWRLWWIGAAIFVLSQVFHIPFNFLVLNPFLQNTLPGLLPDTLPATWVLAIAALLLGLSAGVFEEVARWAGYRWWAKDARSWSKGLLYGAGHGGVEAVLVSGLLLFTYINMMAMRSADLSTLVPPEQLLLARAQFNAFWSAEWYDSFLSFIERASTLPAQIAWSILVLQVFVRRQSRWLLIAILFHALVDAVAVFAGGTWSVYVTEAIMIGFAAISLAIIWIFRQPEPESPLAEGSPLPSSTDLTPAIHPVEETGENLDRTRFSG